MRNTYGMAALLLAGVGVAIGTTTAAELQVQIKTSAGEPLADVVVYVPSSAAKPAGLLTDIDQINKEFVPYVSVVPVGSKIRFPNKDNIRHHVYSFSDPKKFELKLYSGVPAEPVLFDKPGVVTLGCNIHDWMLAHILVVDTPWYGRSNAQGIAVLQLPPGPHTLEYWHPDLLDIAKPQAITVTDHTTPLTLTLALRQRPRQDPDY